MRVAVITAVVVLVLAATAAAQRVEDYRNATIDVHATSYTPLSDGGTLISACASVTSTDGGARKDTCSRAYPGRTPAQRTALGNCLDNGERVWAFDFNIRNDAGF